MNIIIGTKLKNYNLISYFKLYDTDEKYIIYSKRRSLFHIYISKIKIQKDLIKIVKLNKKEIKLIEKIFTKEEIKYRKIPIRDLDNLVYDGCYEKILNKEEYNIFVNSNLIKKYKKRTRLEQIIKEKEKLKKQAIDVDKLETIKLLEQQEYEEKCKLNLVKVIIINIVSLIIIAVLLYGNNLINFINSFKNKENDITYLNRILKLYGMTSLIVLFNQLLAISFHKNFLSKLLVLLSVIVLLLVFYKILVGFEYSISAITVFITMTINIIINFSLYLQLQLKLI